MPGFRPSRGSRLISNRPSFISGRTNDYRARMVDEWAKFRRRRGNRRTQRSNHEPSIALVFNNTGADASEGDIVGLTGAVVPHGTNAQEFANHDWFDGVEPTCASHAARFGVWMEPTADSKHRHAIVSGIATCRVDIKRADHIWCDVADGETGHLESSLWGSCRIIHRESAGTGIQECKVRLSNAINRGPWDVTLNADIDAGATGSVDVRDNGETLTAENCGAQDLKTGEKALMVWDRIKCAFCIVPIVDVCKAIAAIDDVRTAATVGDFQLFISADLSTCYLVDTAECTP